MIIIQFPFALETSVMEITGQVEEEDVSVTVKLRGDVGEGIIKKLKDLGCKIIEPVK